MYKFRYHEQSIVLQSHSGGCLYSLYMFQQSVHIQVLLDILPFSTMTGSPMDWCGVTMASSGHPLGPQTFTRHAQRALPQEFPVTFPLMPLPASCCGHDQSRFIQILVHIIQNIEYATPIIQQFAHLGNPHQKCGLLTLPDHQPVLLSACQVQVLPCPCCLPC